MIKYTRLKEQDGGDGSDDATNPSIRRPNDGGVAVQGTDYKDVYDPEGPGEIKPEPMKTFDMGHLPSVALIEKDGKYYQIKPSLIPQYEGQPGYTVGKMLYTSAFESNIVPLVTELARAQGWVVIQSLYRYASFLTPKQQRASLPNANTQILPNVNEWVSIPEIIGKFERALPATRSDTGQDIQGIFILPLTIGKYKILIDSDESEMEKKNSAKKFVMELTKIVNVSVPGGESKEFINMAVEIEKIIKLTANAGGKIEKYVKHVADQKVALINKALEGLSATPNSFPLLLQKRDFQTGKNSIEQFDPAEWPDITTGDKVILNSKLDPQVAQKWEQLGKFFNTGIVGLFGDKAGSIRTIINAESVGNGQYQFTANANQLDKIINTKRATNMRSDIKLFDNPLNPGEKITWDELLYAGEGIREQLMKKLKVYDVKKKDFLTQFISGIDFVQPLP